MFQAKVVGKVETRILFSVTFFFFEIRTVCEIMWKNIVEPERSRDNIAHAHFILAN